MLIYTITLWFIEIFIDYLQRLRLINVLGDIIQNGKL